MGVRGRRTRVKAEGQRVKGRRTEDQRQKDSTTSLLGVGVGEGRPGQAPIE